MRIALTLLYMTGIRVSNLKHIFQHHLKALLNKEGITITLVKTRHGLISQNFPWQGAYSKIIKEVEDDLKLLIQNAGTEESPFALSREYLNRSLNNIMKKLSVATGKHFRTHSFRINFIDAVTETSGIMTAKALANHQSIETTLRYSRTGLTARQRGTAFAKALTPPSLDSSTEDQIIDVDTSENPE